MKMVTRIFLQLIILVFHLVKLIACVTIGLFVRGFVTAGAIVPRLVVIVVVAVNWKMRK